MKFNNAQIYRMTKNITDIFNNFDLYIPVKANFILSKNIAEIIRLGEEIETARLKIASHYGVLDQEKNQYVIPPEKIQEANQEINDLFAIEQDLDIKMIKLEDLGNIELTPKQMQALMFMIEE